MQISTRRRARLLLLAALAVVGAGAAFAWFVWRQRQLDSEALDARTAGLAALEARDWPRALHGLGTYLGRAAENGTATATDYVRYAKARRNVVLPNNRNISDAIACLKKAHDMEPSNEEAQNDLLELYRVSGHGVEAVELIDKMLVTRSDQLALLRTKSDIFESQRRFQQALEVAQ